MKRLLLASLLIAVSIGFAQTTPPPATETSSTSTDIFIMGGTDVTRPGANLRANLNIGAGHTFSFLKKNPFGDELTFSYTYENGGSHGFFHTQYGSHTENVGVMKNFSIPGIKNLGVKGIDSITFYTWPLIGITSMTGNDYVLNRLYLGAAFGSAIHFTSHHAIWVQETWNKVLTCPGYPSTNIGYTYSR